MGKALRNVMISNNSQEDMRAWIGALLDAMLEAGFVQTNDTGQVDPETVELTAETSSTAWAVFRFDDALQATHPIFFKVLFSNSSSTSTTSPGVIALEVGKGSDGSGNITDQFLSVSAGTQGVSTIAWSNVGASNHAAITGDGYAGLFLYASRTDVSSYSPQGCFLIERSRDAQGNITGSGVLVVTGMQAVSPTASSTAAMNGANSVSLGSNRYELGVRAVNYATGLINLGMAPVTTFGTIAGAELSNSPSLAAGSVGPVFPWDVIAPGLAPWRSCVLVSIPAGDMPGDVFETNLCGRMGSFYPIPPSSSNNRFGIAMGTTGVSRWFGAGIRWED